MSTPRVLGCSLADRCTQPTTREKAIMTMDTAWPVPSRTGAVTAPAIEAHDLVKTYPKGVRALDGLSFAVPAGTVFAPARPERGGQVHHRQDPHHAGPGRLRHRDRGRWPGRPRQASPGAPHDRSRRPAQRRGPGGHRPGERPAVRQDPGPARAGAHPPGRRTARPVRARRRGRPQGAHLLRRHAAAPRRGDGPGPPADGRCSSTSPPPAWTRSRGRPCGRRLGGCPRPRASPSC